ncbi:MAG: sulfite exporter TauE/SafE family protein [Nitrospirota bacterium]
METGYLLALTTGIIGGFGHCIGMCGPLVASYALASPAGRLPLSAQLTHHLLYNMGRITTYGLVGAFMGLSGSFVNSAGRLAGIQNAVAVMAGLLMIIMGMSIAGILGPAAWIEKHNISVLRTARRFTGSPSAFRFYPLGLLLGLLPCGLSYTVFIASAGTGGMLSGAATSLLFGFGTLPALLLFGTLFSSLTPSLRGGLYKAGGILVIAMGIYYLARGMKLYAGL